MFVYVCVCVCVYVCVCACETSGEYSLKLFHNECLAYTETVQNVCTNIYICQWVNEAVQRFTPLSKYICIHILCINLSCSVETYVYGMV